MAATAIAYPLDAMCAAYNPAGIVWVGDRIDGGFAWLHDTGSATVSGNTLPAILGVNGKFKGMRTKDIYAGEGGFTKTFCCDCFQWAVGLIIYNRNFQKTTYHHFLPLFGTTHAGLEYLNETISPVAAVRFWDCHSFGVSMDWQISRLKVNGLQNFDNATFSAHPGHVTNKGYSWSQGLTATIGYRWQVTDGIAVGVTYRPRTKMHKWNKYIGFMAQGRVDIPEKIGAGIAVDVLPCVTAAFDWEHIRWNNVRALHNPLLPNLFNSKLGDKNGVGFGFRNQDYYRVGLEYRHSEIWTFRIGFRHANTPIRKSQTAVNILTLDLVEDFLTVGATWAMTPCNEFSFFYAYGFEHTVNGKNAIPPGAPFFGGNVKLKERKQALAFGWGWKY
jgi:long-chain fatty acid transport protein